MTRRHTIVAFAWLLAVLGAVVLVATGIAMEQDGDGSLDVLLAVFAGGVLGLQALLTDVTQGQTLAVAASTLAAPASFQPIRRRVQRAVDPRFDRARYDGERTAAASMWLPRGAR